MTSNSALEAVSAAFAVVDAVIYTAIPLTFGIVGVVVAANWALGMLGAGSGSDDYDADGNFAHDNRE